MGLLSKPKSVGAVALTRTQGNGLVVRDIGREYLAKAGRVSIGVRIWL